MSATVSMIHPSTFPVFNDLIFKDFYFIYFSIFLFIVFILYTAYMYVSAPASCSAPRDQKRVLSSATRSEEGVGFPGIGVVEGC